MVMIESQRPTIPPMRYVPSWSLRSMLPVDSSLSLLLSMLLLFASSFPQPRDCSRPSVSSHQRAPERIGNMQRGNSSVSMGLEDEDCVVYGGVSDSDGDCSSTASASASASAPRLITTPDTQTGSIEQTAPLTSANTGSPQAWGAGTGSPGGARLHTPEKALA